ncbi:MAG: DUF748 domain-containing protein [Candidatus Omnitrophota bacterium]
MRRFFLFLTALTAIVLALLFYAKKTYFPIRLKQMVIQKAERILRRPVSIESLKFNPIKGFDLRHLIIFEDASRKDIFLHVDRISFNVLFLSFLQNRNIVIPSLSLDRVYIRLIRKKQSGWNFSDLLPAGEKDKKTTLPSLILGRLSVTDSAIQITDRMLYPEYGELIENVNIKANLLLKKRASFSLEAGRSKEKLSYLTASGDFDPLSQQVNSEVHIKNINLVKYLSLYFDLSRVRLDHAFMDTSDLVVRYQNHHVKVNSISSIKDLQATFDDKWTFTGNPTVRFDLDFDPTREKKLIYQGAVRPRQGRLAGIPIVDTVTDIKGILYFKENELTAESLKGKTIDTLFELNGTLRNFQNPIIEATLNSSIELPKLNIFFPDFFKKEQIETSGLAALNVNYKIDPAKSPTPSIDLVAQIEKGTLKAKRLPALLSDIAGGVKYSQNKITWKDLSFQMYDTLIHSSAAIEDLKKPYIRFEAKSEVDLKNLAAFFPEIFTKERIDLSGEAQVSFSYDGAPDVPKIVPVIQAKALIRNASLAASKLPAPLTKIAGELEYANNRLSWNNFSLNFKDTKYLLNGSMKRFEKPKLQTTLTSDHLNLSADLDILRNAFNITSLLGNYYNSTFDVQGYVRYPSDDIQLDLAGDLNVDLADLGQLFPGQEDRFKALAPKGICSISGSFIGQVNDWPHWQISAVVKSPEISLNGYKAKISNMKLEPLSSNFHQLDLLATAYKGSIVLKSSFDLAQKDIPVSAVLEVEKVDLGELKKDLNLKDKEFQGILSGQTSLAGLLKEPDTLRGNGSAAIRDGRLWRLNLLDNFGKFLLIPEYADITFKDAAGNFVIEKQRILIDDLELKSRPMTMLCRGWLDFAGNLNFYLFSRFSEETIARSESLKKIITAVLTQTDNYLTIRLTGTLKEPRYLVIPESVDVIKRAGDFILDTLQNIFE